MILTGKCKEDFLKWKVDNKNLSTIEVLDFKHLSNISKNSLIIEFFDEQGIYINISVTYGVNWNINQYGGEDYNNRQEATTEAIKKANEIYNSL